MIATVTWADGSTSTVEPELIGMEDGFAVYVGRVCFPDLVSPVRVEVDAMPGRSTLRIEAQ